MKVLTPHVIAKTISVIAFLSIMTMTAILFYFLSLRLGEIAKENHAYDKFITCVLSVPSGVRDQRTIDKCYDKAQEGTHVRIIRYDQGIQ